MTVLFVFLYLCVDTPPANDPAGKSAKTELPDNARDYFRRTDELKATTIASFERKIADIKVEMRNAAPNRQAFLKKELQSVEKELEKTSPLKPFSFLPDRRTVSDIGMLPQAQVARIVDETTVVIRVPKGSFANLYVVQNFSTKSLKPGQAFQNSGFWKVTALKVEDGTIARAVNAVGDVRYCPVIEAVPKDDMDQYEALYEAEKKANGGKPLPRQPKL